MAQKGEIKWINFAKLTAILAVLIDHSEMILYSNGGISMATYFSVTLFVFISGMMLYKSVTGHNLGYLNTVSKNLKRILPAYMLAVFIYQLAYTGFFDFTTYLGYLINFNICGHFYYVAVYIQLTLIGWVLVRTISNISCKYSVLIEAAVGILILAVSSYTTLHTNVLYIYGGGGKLFGGTYLFIFYLGMFAMKHNIFGKINFTTAMILTIISLACTVIWWKFECINHYSLDAKLPFGEGINPPSVSTTVMMLCVAIFCFSFITVLENITKLTAIVDFMSKLGRHTLYIFLYHRIVLDKFLVPMVNIGNIWIKRIIFMLLMISVPVIIEYILTEIKAFLTRPTEGVSK